MSQPPPRSDPPRLRDPIVEAGRDELPDERQLAALAAKLGPILGPPNGGGGGAGGAGHGATALKAALWKKVALVAAVGAVGIGGGVAAVTSRSSSAPPPVTGLVATAAFAGDEADAALALAPAPRDEPVPSAAPHAQHAPDPAANPQEEVRLLQRAQDALASSPDEALRLTAEHARRFPSGALAQEREVLAIDALVRSGRRTEAKARADRFAKTWPSSTHLRRIEVLTAP